MNKDVLVPDELIIDFSLPKEEIKKQLDDYEKACNEAFKKWGLSEDKKEKNILKIIRKEQRKYYKNSYLRKIIEIVAKLNSDEE